MDFAALCKAMKEKNAAKFWESLAYLVGDSNSLSSNCKNFQTGWNHAMDEIIKALGNKINGDNKDCTNYLYSAPKLLMDYLKVWCTLNETAIVEATFVGFDVDRAGQKACFN